MEKNKIYEDMLQVAQQAARVAGEHARDQILSARVDIKGADQIVTQLDRECQNLIVRHIHYTFPHHGIIAEEGPAGQPLHQHPTHNEDIWWIIDPIDGTRNFAHDAANYAVSIGVIHRGQPVAGVIFDPTTDQMFTAHQDGPAHCNNRPIHCSEESLNSNSQIAVSGNIFPHLGPQTMAALMKNHVLMNLGSAALHFAYIAKGSFVALFAWNLKLWDIAGGAVICQAAGAHVLNAQHRPCFPLDPRSYSGQSLPVFIASESVYQQLKSIIV